MYTRHFFALTCWLLGLTAVFADTAPPVTSRPNILIIYADDMGYGDLAIQNPKGKIPTPNLDQLAREGLRFTDGHSSSGICTPSRYALLTGRYHWRDFHGIVNSLGKSVFKPEQVTLPELLQQAGYRTACIGKWHLGWGWNALRKPDVKHKVKNHFSTFDWSRRIPDGPLDHGFDYYFGDTVINFPPYAWIENDRVVKAPDTMLDTSKWKPIKEGNWECRGGPMVEDWDPYAVLPTLTEKAVEFIKQQAGSDQPFFLYFPLPAPHAPIIPLDEFDGKSGAGPYGDFVVQVDYSCGQVLKALEASGRADNTLVIFTADNGPEHYAYARDEKFDHWSAAPFRGLKRDIYEGGHHVPFLVRWPGVIKPGQVSDALISQVDIMATLAGIVGVVLPKGAAPDSLDQQPVLTRPSASIRKVHVHNTFKNRYAVREGDWLLIDAPNGYHSRRNPEWEKKHDYPADDDQPVELYNLAEDIGQRRNVAADHPEKVEHMKQLLQRIRQHDSQT